MSDLADGGQEVRHAKQPHPSDAEARCVPSRQGDREAVHEAKIRDAELRDQATRASKSCFLTLCEGLPNDGVAMRRKYFTESHNSLHEVVGAVDLAHAIGAVDGAMASEVLELAARLKKMLRALLR
jgi:four helix bundle protein